MRPLLAIKSCHAHASHNQVIRNTWLLNREVDYKFFLGSSLNGSPMGGTPRTSDEVWLDCDDGYASLPFKTQALLGWALERGYQNIFLCDTDTYVCVPRLLTSGYAEHDYIGCFTTCKSCVPTKSGHCQCVSGLGEQFYSYASGGAGYWLSADAARLVLESKFIIDPLIPDREEQSTRGEDLQVGWTLGKNGIVPYRDMRYSLWWPGPLLQNDVITLHDYTRLNRTTDRMMIIHRAWVCSGGC